MKALLPALFLAAAFTLRAAEPAGFYVHEWGTFTSFQDEAGHAIAGINTDDEPVPLFVHNVASFLLLPPDRGFNIAGKGLTPHAHPQITMRLETPVLYFHAPAKLQATVDVRVGFEGGWLTQFYPMAAAENPGIVKNTFRDLSAKTKSSLAWPGLKLNATTPAPATSERVWLAPRAVDAAAVSTAAGETEKFLFYRGVGHLEAPLRVQRSADGGTLEVVPAEPALKIGKLWLVDIRPDGRAAWRTLEQPGATAASFAEEAYRPAADPGLRVNLRTALIADGLAADEAEALLNTWEVSYFKSPGLRLFFLVPQAWTDRVLPLTITGAPAMTRVMVGRIEIVTPAQRALLAQMAALPVIGTETQGTESVAAYNWNTMNALYLQLGRFRNALLLESQGRRASPGMKTFTGLYGLQPYDLSAK